MKIRGIEFDVEVDWDTDGKIDRISVFLPESEQELSEVLSDKVLEEIETEIYRLGPDQPDDDWRHDR